MGIMGHGYGSEFHFLRYLGYHRHDLNHAVEQETGGRVLDWLDFSFDTKRRFPHLDVEWRGTEFLDPNASMRSAWKNFWPQTGNVPNWDAIGLLQSESQVEYLLIEAKAHTSEIKSDCSASEDGGLPRIREAFAETIRAYGFTADPEKWLRPYYQYANRLAHLYFFLQHAIRARLIFIYFLGDDFTVGGHGGREQVLCPKTEEEWEGYLNEMHDHLGLSGRSELEQRVHKLFLHV